MKKLIFIILLTLVLEILFIKCAIALGDNRLHINSEMPFVDARVMFSSYLNCKRNIHVDDSCQLSIPYVDQLREVKRWCDGDENRAEVCQKIIELADYHKDSISAVFYPKDPGIKNMSRKEIGLRNYIIIASPAIIDVMLEFLPHEIILALSTVLVVIFLRRKSSKTNLGCVNNFERRGQVCHATVAKKEPYFEAETLIDDQVTSMALVKTENVIISKENAKEADTEMIHDIILENQARLQKMCEIFSPYFGPGCEKTIIELDWTKSETLSNM